MTKAVSKMDDWRFWVGIAYFGLAFVVVWLFFLNQSSSKTQARQARDEAVRVAEIDSAQTAQRQQCLASIPTLRRINGFVAGVSDLHMALEGNAKAVLDATAKTNPLYRVRLSNWRRIRSTVSKVAGVHFPVPTVKQCRARGKPAR